MFYIFYYVRDRLRTAVNVMGDCYCSGVISHWFQDDFEDDDIEDNNIIVVSLEAQEQTSF